jgi:hypothetical protein
VTDESDGTAEAVCGRVFAVERFAVLVEFLPWRGLRCADFSTLATRVNRV